MVSIFHFGFLSEEYCRNARIRNNLSSKLKYAPDLILKAPSSHFMMLNSLPNELLVNIFKYLRADDLINISEVSENLFEVATIPSLWKRVEICEDKDAQKVNNILNFIKTNVFKLRRLKISVKQFTGINQRLFIEVAKKTSALSVKIIGENHHTPTTYRQNFREEGSLFTEIVENLPPSRLRYLYCEGINLSKITSSRLSNFIEQLQSFEAHECFFQEDQIDVIHQNMSANSNLHIMDPYDHHIKCDLCDKYFNSEDGLKEHFELVHNQNKKRILTSKLCVHCPDGWTYWTYSHHNLRRHMIQHSEFWPSDEVQGLELLCLVKTKLKEAHVKQGLNRYRQNGQ